MRIADDIPEAEPEIDLVSHEVQRLDRVVRTFLDLNRPAELEIREFDPVEVCSEVLETMRPAATQAGVDLQLVKPVMPFAVRADRGLIEQALLNVVNNAIQAMTGVEGKRVVKTVVSLSSGNCEIAVTDNGPGMPVSVRDRIFEPYFTTKESGSGIGLAQTKKAMELHRGRISVESSPGHGTTMLLIFPANPFPAGRSASA
jgi:signal transduction histidine kinase